MTATRNTCTLAEQALEDCRQALEEVIHTEPARRGSPSITNKCAWALQAIEDYRRAAAEPEALASLPPCRRCGGTGRSALPGNDDVWDEIDRIAHRLVELKKAAEPEAKAKADVSNALNGRCDHGMLLTRTCAQCDR